MNNFEHYHNIIHKDFLVETICTHESAHLIYINTHKNIEICTFNLKISNKDGRIVGGDIECKTPLFVPLEVGGSGFAGIIGEYFYIENRYGKNKNKNFLEKLKKYFLRIQD